MPELPEVETVARQLAPLLEGKTVQRVQIFDKRIGGSFSKLRNSRIIGTERLGKQVLLTLQSASHTHYLAIHLRMTGRLIWFEQQAVIGQEARFVYPQQEAKEKSMRVKLICEEGELRFYDTRRFGTFELSPSKAAFEPKGVDPVSDSFTVNVLKGLAQGSRQPLKNWLLRQDKIVGLGNIYVCEILFAAKLSPFREPGSLDRNELRRLYRHTRTILSRAIENCGTTFSDFQTAEGEIGEYQQFLKVYGREGESCPRCRATLLRYVQAGRSTFYCPDCQQ